MISGACSLNIIRKIRVLASFCNLLFDIITSIHWSLSYNLLDMKDFFFVIWEFSFLMPAMLFGFILHKKENDQVQCCLFHCKTCNVNDKTSPNVKTSFELYIVVSEVSLPFYDFMMN